MGGGMMKRGMYKKGSFPDLNKDGKITKADILKGRGVFSSGSKNPNAIKSIKPSVGLKKTEEYKKKLKIKKLRKK